MRESQPWLSKGVSSSLLFDVWYWSYPGPLGGWSRVTLDQTLLWLVISVPDPLSLLIWTNTFTFKRFLKPGYLDIRLPYRGPYGGRVHFISMWSYVQGTFATTGLHNLIIFWLICLICLISTLLSSLISTPFWDNSALHWQGCLHPTLLCKWIHRYLFYKLTYQPYFASKLLI